MSKSLLIHGNFLHTIEGKLEILENSYITVKNGKISCISKEKPPETFEEFFKAKPNQLILPGLIDTHIHAPQYVFCGCGLDLPLLDWLNTYTFPAESKFSDVEYAKKVYETVVKRTLDFGTTTASYFATIWTESSVLLSEICKKKGQRAFVGKVSMDRNSPDFYVEKTEDAKKNEENFISTFTDKDSLVQPTITPRFVPTCTGDLMKNLGDLAKNGNLHIQSHLDENIGEIEWVKQLHPDSKSYTHVYDEFGLLTDKTILAHAVHITDEELLLIKERGASIAHCPASNFGLFSGIADVRHMMDLKVKVGLGTDVAGGPTPSLIEAMRSALTCSRAHLFQRRKEGTEKDYKPLNNVDVFCLATEKGAEALNIEDKVGNFKVGKEFDAIVVDMTKGACDCFKDETPMDLFDKFIQRADDRNIIKVFVQGKLVKNLE